MPDLPYFDLLIDERQDGGETGQLWEHQVHWGYWEDPKAAEGTRADYIAAMEQMNGVLLEAGKVADGQRLLDVGCGFGGTIQQINAAHSDMHLTGLNIDPRQLAAAEAQTTAANGNQIDWVEADACQLPFEDNSFDRVLAVECIFHFPSRERSSPKPRGCSSRAATSRCPTSFRPWPSSARPRSGWRFAPGSRSPTERSGTCPSGPTRRWASVAGLQLDANRNIRKNTLPTYPFLIKFFREQGSADAQKTMIVGTRWIKWLTKAGLLQYRVYTFYRPSCRISSGAVLAWAISAAPLPVMSHRVANCAIKSSRVTSMTPLTHAKTASAEPPTMNAGATFASGSRSNSTSCTVRACSTSTPVSWCMTATR